MLPLSGEQECSGPPRPRSGSWLRKWYLDVTSEDGEAAICYRAAIRWGVVRLSYASVLWSRPGVAVESRTSFRRGSEPSQGDGVIAWGDERLGVSGEWAAADGAFERTLHEEPAGAVRWSCLMPRARATVRLNGAVIRGWGYAEVLELSLVPWRLPIDELRWGRFAGAAGSVVWIEWRGSRPVCLVLVNGREAPGARVGDSDVAWAGGHLALGSGRTLRCGRLGSTVLATPPLRLIAPRSVRAIDEHKVLCRGEMFGEGAPTEGWAIHEIVRLREAGS